MVEDAVAGLAQLVGGEAAREREQQRLRLVDDLVGRNVGEILEIVRDLVEGVGDGRGLFEVDPAVDQCLLYQRAGVQGADGVGEFEGGPAIHAVLAAQPVGDAAMPVFMQHAAGVDFADDRDPPAGDRLLQLIQTVLDQA